MAIERILQKLPEWFDWQLIKEQLTKRTVQLGILTTLLSSYVIYKRLTKKRYRLPPGPLALPLIGNIHTLGYSNYHVKFSKLSKIYGPVFTIYLGPIRAIVLNNTKVTREAFIQKGPDFAGRAKTWSATKFSDNGQDIVFSQYGPAWKLQRKIAHAALRKYAGGEKIGVLVENSFRKITKEIEKAEGPIDPSDYLLLFIYNVFSSMCFGRQFEVDDPFVTKVQKLFKIVFEDSGAVAQIALIDAFPVLSNPIFGLRIVKMLDEVMDDFNNFIANEFETHIRNYDKNSLNDLMDEVIYHWKEAELQHDDKTVLSQLTRRNFELIIFNIFGAGTDTTRITLAWVLLYLAKYPEIQKKAYAEVDTVFGNSSPTIHARDKLHYVYAVLHEAMRIAPVASIGVPHLTMCDTTLAGYDIPKNTMVFSNTYGMQNDPTEFKEPNKFNPDRWMDSNGKINLQAGTFVPFSMGTRVCVGESLAKVEIMMTLAFFIQKFEFVAAEGVELDDEPIDIGGGLGYKQFKIFFKPRY